MNSRLLRRQFLRCLLSLSLAAAFCSCVFSTVGATVGAYVRLNQAGYLTGDNKRAILMATNAESGTFNVVNVSNGTTVFFAAIPATNFSSWNVTFTNTYLLDFSVVTNPGIYTVQVAAGINATSPPVTIGTAAGIFRPLLTNALFYFESSRDGTNIINVISRKPSHTNDQTALTYLPPVYDVNDVLVGGLTNVGGPMDVSGGWFDAGDYIKIVETTSYVEGMMLFAMRDYPTLLSAGADFRGEARYGLDWLFKMWDQTNQVFYYAVAIGDGNGNTILGDHDLWRLPEKDDPLNVGVLGQTNPTNSEYYIKYRPAFRAGTSGALISPNLAGRMAASFALGSQVFRATDPAYADRCLVAAQTVFNLAKTNWSGNLLTAPPYDFYSESEWRDDIEWGASELYFATAQVTNAPPPGLLQTNPVFYLQRSAYWASKYTADYLNLYDCGPLAHYELFRAIVQAGNPSGLATTTNTLVTALKNLLASGATQSAKDPFGFYQPYGSLDDPTPHALCFAITANFYRKLTGVTTYNGAAQAQRDWVLGNNAWGTTFIVGAGSTFPHCMQDQIGNLSGHLDGTPPIRLGATVDGPANSLSGNGTVGGARSCDLSSTFSPFDGKGALFRDGAAYWMTVEPALDYSVPTILLFAQQIGELTPPVLKTPFVLPDGTFSLNVTGSTGFSYIVQSSTNFISWLPLQTNTSPFSFTDSNAAGFPFRFYRAQYFH